MCVAACLDPKRNRKGHLAYAFTPRPIGHATPVAVWQS